MPGTASQPRFPFSIRLRQSHARNTPTTAPRIVQTLRTANKPQLRHASNETLPYLELTQSRLWLRQRASLILDVEGKQRRSSRAQRHLHSCANEQSKIMRSIDVSCLGQH